MILPGQNKYLAKQYFDSLPSGDSSRQYFEGTKYQSPTNTFARLYNFLTVPQRLQTLKGFYPYQRTIVATEKEYEHDWQTGLTYSLGFTAGSWFLLFNFARYGYVAPVLREYGWFLKTHRLFRHYLLSLVVPLALTAYSIHDKYYDHMEVLWTIHANRLNKKLLEDPQSTIYPENLRDKLRIF